MVHLEFVKNTDGTRRPALRFWECPAYIGKHDVCKIPGCRKILGNRDILGELDIPNIPPNIRNRISAHNRSHISAHIRIRISTHIQNHIETGQLRI